VSDQRVKRLHDGEVHNIYFSPHTACV